MLRITTNSSSAVAKRYYTTADYYSEGQEVVGIWHGEGARRLGLSGNIQQHDWDALCDNLNPTTGDQLTVRRRLDRRVGYDFTFNAPKSLSLLYGLTGDERLSAAVSESVRETMADMEREMKTRVRRGGKDEDRITGNFVWGEYVHTTARPVGGIPDPSLHVHAFVFNATYDFEESRFKAGQFADQKIFAPFHEAMFHARLARRMEELGLETIRTKDRWELAAIPTDVLRQFSRRTTEIERKARERGITDPEKKSQLGAKTRQRKNDNHSFSQLQAIWKSWLSPEDSERLAVLGHQIGQPALPEQQAIARQAVDQAELHCFERSAVIPERRLLTEALKQGVGKASVQTIESEYQRHGFITGTRDGRRMVTTRAVLAEEQRLIDMVRRGHGTCPMLGGGREHIFKQTKLNADQRRAVLHVLQSRDKIIAVRGAAGVGKTWSMREAADAIEANGHRVFALAPSAEASRKVLREEAKFADAETVAMFLADERLHGEVKPGDVLWVDEAGTLSTKTAMQVFDLAERLQVRVVLQGDKYQHSSVEKGSVLHLLEEEAGLVPAEIKEIKRQDGDYKRVVEALSEGRVGDAFEQLDNLGWIREIDGAERYKVLAADYVDAITKGDSALVISPTHAEKNRCTKQIRFELKRLGRLAEEERVFKTLSNADFTDAQRSDSTQFGDDHVLVFHQNAAGYRRGQRVMVKDAAAPLPFGQASRFQVFEQGELKLAAGELIRITHGGKTLEGRRLNNGDIHRVKGFTAEGDIKLDNGSTLSREFGFLDWAYVNTSQASQSRSVARVYIGQSSDSAAASSREQAYVSISRGKKQATIYTDDKEGLLAAVSRSDERLTATEFISSKRTRDRWHDQQPARHDDVPAHRRDRDRHRSNDMVMQ